MPYEGPCRRAAYGAVSGDGPEPVGGGPQGSGLWGARGGGSGGSTRGRGWIRGKEASRTGRSRRPQDGGAPDEQRLAPREHLILIHD